MITCDLIIVGQGLAGSVLALQLQEKGFDVMLIDKPELSRSSRVAGGVWNPVVFKRLSKSWKVDEILPEMIGFYRKAEKDLGVKLITDRNIIKLFSEQQEIDLWTKKADGELSNYLDRNIYSDQIEGIRNSPLGYSKVLRSGNLDMNAFLTAVERHFVSKDRYRNEIFDHSFLEIKDGIQYKDIIAGSIVFAEGYLIKNNPLFSYVPMKPAKGEVVNVELSVEKKTNDVLTKNAFLLPLGGKNYKAGATFNWDDLTDIISEKGLLEIKDKLEKIVAGEFRIVKQEAGVRPSVIDRRPVMGRHPKHRNIYLFNGMGSKGVMLAPFFAKRLAELIAGGTPLESEVDLSRFNSFFVS